MLPNQCQLCPISCTKLNFKTNSASLNIPSSFCIEPSHWSILLIVHSFWQQFFRVSNRGLSHPTCDHRYAEHRNIEPGTLGMHRACILQPLPWSVGLDVTFFDQAGEDKAQLQNGVPKSVDPVRRPRMHGSECPLIRMASLKQHDPPWKFTVGTQANQISYIHSPWDDSCTWNLFFTGLAFGSDSTFFSAQGCKGLNSDNVLRNILRTHEFIWDIDRLGLNSELGHAACSIMQMTRLYSEPGIFKLWQYHRKTFYGFHHKIIFYGFYHKKIFYGFQKCMDSFGTCPHKHDKEFKEEWESRNMCYFQSSHPHWV